MKKKYVLKFKEFDDLKDFLKKERNIEFNPPIRIKTLVTNLTDTELKTIIGGYNLEEWEIVKD